MKGRTGKKLKLATAVCTAVLLLASVLDHASPLQLERYQARGTLLFAETGELLSALPAPDQHLRFATTGTAVSPTYLQLLLRTEDKRFYSHFGVDPLAVARAVQQMLGAGEVVSGASTLSMQTVRLLEPRPRTLRSKLIEMLRAIQLEAHYSKDDILAMYLTLAPYGGTIEGIEAASRLWLDKPPATLTLAEAALLVALPQSPERLRPDRFPDAALAARNRILERAAANGLITAQQLSDAKSVPIPTARHRLPDYARHLAERLAAKAPGQNFVTTLDATLTIALTDMLKRETLQLPPDVTAAALVVETATGRVRAYVGNADYYDRRRRGMVDMIPALRSPGSALKPFIYAMGFEGLIVHPATIVRDTPQRFEEYAPRNFDGAFHGDMTVAEALQLSLNLPAVALLSQIGPVAFDSRLMQAGVTLAFDRSEGRAALPIALGGVGITLEQMTYLYGAFGNHGDVVPLHRMKEDADAPRQAFLQPAAAWYVRDILHNTPTPSGFADLAGGTDGPLAYKTGTSYGQRDAWAMGLTDHYTLGFWVGRADGQPCPNCVGIRAAAPLLIRATGLLPRAQAKTAMQSPPAGVLHVTSAEQLPPVLQRFGLRPKGSIAPPPATTRSAELPLQLRFPIDGTIVEIAEGTTILPLKAEGGVRPLIWFVNGAVVPSDPLQRENSWPISSPGFVHVTVKDATGASVSAEAFLSTGDQHD